MGTLCTMNEKMRNVRVRLTVLHDGETTAVDTVGTLVPRNDGWLIQYRETSPDLAGVTTTLILERDVIVVRREGALRSEQRFVPGRSTAGRYETPYGAFPLVTKTSRLSVRFRGCSWEAEWAYELVIGGAAGGTFLANLHVQEAEA